MARPNRTTEVYAAGTKVSVMQSQFELRSMLAKYGASAEGMWTDGDQVTVAFRLNERNIKFKLSVPVGTTAGIARQQRERWRALLLAIKAKLISVDSGIETFEEAFLAQVVMPSGDTVYEEIGKNIQLAYEQGAANVPLLPRRKSP